MKTLCELSQKNVHHHADPSKGFNFQPRLAFTICQIALLFVHEFQCSKLLREDSNPCWIKNSCFPLESKSFYLFQLYLLKILLTGTSCSGQAGQNWYTDLLTVFFRLGACDLRTFFRSQMISSQGPHPWPALATILPHHEEYLPCGLKRAHPDLSLYHAISVVYNSLCIRVQARSLKDINSQLQIIHFLWNYILHLNSILVHAGIQRNRKLPNNCKYLQCYYLPSFPHGHSSFKFNDLTPGSMINTGQYSLKQIKKYTVILRKKTQS